ncbi:hypothetical protein DFAR_2480051 [Desulfarculales bacterium]
MTLEEHAHLIHLILSRWTSNHYNARLERLNGIFQAARARARGYRNIFNLHDHDLLHRRTTGGTHQAPQLTTKNKKKPKAPPTATTLAP